MESELAQTKLQQEIVARRRSVRPDAISIGARALRR